MRVIGDGQPLIQSASVAATELIREAILDGRLTPGQRLKEEDLAQDLGISRTPVREALRVLQTEGLVVAERGRGATVREHSPEDLDDLYQIRALLEGYAARRAAMRANATAIASLRVICDRFAALVSNGVIPDGALQEVVRENMLFHDAILELAGSSRLKEMVRKVIELPLVYKSYIWYSPDQTLLSAEDHRQIVDAIEARDGERAERVIKEHVLKAGDLLIGHLRRTPRGEQPAESKGTTISR